MMTIARFSPRAHVQAATLYLLTMIGAISGPAAGPATAETAADEAFEAACMGVTADGTGRVVCADLAALDQTLVYNRFGSYNPFGMIFALRRDLAPAAPDGSDAGHVDATLCRDGKDGTETVAGDLSPGDVRLKDCERPRPMVLRVNVGDKLLVKVENLLALPDAPDFSSDFCKAAEPHDAGRRKVRVHVREAPRRDGEPAANEKRWIEHTEADCLGAEAAQNGVGDNLPAAEPDWPQTRLVNLVAQGLHPEPLPGEADVHPACRGTGAVPPGESFHCLYGIDQEGTYFFASLAAPAGGEGDGGSIVHGAFGAVLAERAGSRWYRSQVSAHALDTAWPVDPNGPRHARRGAIDYEAIGAGGVPILNMAHALDAGQEAFANARHVQLVHTDVSAIIWCDDRLPGANCRDDTDGMAPTVEPAYRAFREFSVFFHDELKTFYTKNFRELAQFGQLAGVRDGFGINYGASGMGPMVLANRKGIGPAAECMECLYEEFFLTSWANGDPALLEWYADDPSNVHHSYLNDPVVFRNFHAGPKETHVFHLHAHQWFAGNDPNRGSYLDSQTVGPQQGFTYNIYHGGLRGVNGGDKGWWDTAGSGNRNRTIGDSIFHCHLYPHFAQGMWELWRVHDVFEDGTRRLPDGQADEGLSVDFRPDNAHRRTGSVDRISGRWLAPDPATGDGLGTPIPALVPLPGEPLPLIPTYADDGDVDADGQLSAEAATPMPGYPFYIAGQPGHRPPQAPLDIARNFGPSPGLDGTIDGRSAVDTAGEPLWLDGGIGRHVVADRSERKMGIEVPETVADGTPVQALEGERREAFAAQLVAKAFALGDLSAKLTRANIETLSHWGTRLERAAMGFHWNGHLYEEDGKSGTALKLASVVAAPSPTGGAASHGVAFTEGGYPTTRAPLPGDTAAPAPTALFGVNASPPKPGAPFADPCGVGIAARAPFRSDGILTATTRGPDPFVKGLIDGEDFIPDPMLNGFRRYEVSAVQLDMIVNRAGWHDPQARIDVLTAEAGRYKDGPPWRVSPKISDSEEPFFFRALSGECIEFRHTNELPKELELDDFQVKTPTDTIGQHIHLVKFDVTSSDGSGNGFNYEDGTFAPDELLVRRCAARAAVGGTVTGEGSLTPAGEAECKAAEEPGQEHWRKVRAASPELFQTTTQRWFADPILSIADNGDTVDRTMRTVFTHDHFGPSSIQQHGFYAALVVEPGAHHSGEWSEGSQVPSHYLPSVCPSEKQASDADEGCVGPLPDTDRLTSVAWGSKPWEGTRKRIVTARNAADAERFSGAFEHPNYREFALSIADFALLYDPRQRTPHSLIANVANEGRDPGTLEGMAKLWCEALWRLQPWAMENVCLTPPVRDETTSRSYPGEVPPAWVAGGVNRDDHHKWWYVGDLFRGSSEIDALRKHLVAYRQMAAGGSGEKPGAHAAMAQPIAAPERPESISVDHHDPYLVNYRGAPIPLRVGTKEKDGSASPDCALKPMTIAGREPEGKSPVVEALENRSFEECSVAYQRTDAEGGDLGQALSSRLHGDPETPVLQAYHDDRIVLRMIQGAQEVQHTFNVVGQPFKRNIDQHWMRGMQPLGVSGRFKDSPNLQARCFERDELINTRPSQYRLWLDGVPERLKSDGLMTDDEIGWWALYEEALAECDNAEGFSFAQEIGISEHFEMQGSLRFDVGLSAEATEFAAIPAGDDLSADGVPMRSSDYFYSFGTVDALWNGAWGLIRIFEDEDAKDPNTLAVAPSPGTDPAAIGERLLTLPRVKPENVAVADDARSENGLACPIPDPQKGETQRIVETAIVAVETRRVFPDQDGTRYGEKLTDPDGLFLALLSPADLGVLSLGDGGGFGALTADGVIEAIRAAYDEQPEPFVLRVTAGDCLRLRLLNLMGEAKEPAMRDLLGDALLPRIVTLNNDPTPEVDDDFDGTGRSVGLLEPLPDTGHGLPSNANLRPSARLALSLGLPGLDLIRDVPAGYGYNKPALEGGRGGVRVSNVIVAYAGRVRSALPSDPGAARDALAFGAEDRLAARITADTLGLSGDAPLGITVASAQGSEQGLATVLGRGYVVTLARGGETVTLTGPAAAPDRDATLFTAADGTGTGNRADITEVLATQLKAALLEALDEYTHFIPYAFGAVPVHPAADVITQGPHGLFGAIDVTPVTWTAVGDTGVHCDAADGDGWVRCAAGYARPVGQGNAMTYSAEAEDGETVRLREFVLFWQDGLNLWDSDKPLPWRWKDAPSSGGPVRDADGRTAMMVPDCGICDDSYDLGEAGVSYMSPGFHRVLRELLPGTDLGAEGTIRRHQDLNAYRFPADYLVAAPETMNLRAETGEQLVIRVVHPGGRARQRAFAMNGYSYLDLFPGFGFPRSALLAPGKAISAWLWPAATKGVAVWHDGPLFLRSAGTWGLLTVSDAASAGTATR